MELRSLVLSFSDGDLRSAQGVVGQGSFGTAVICGGNLYRNNNQQEQHMHSITKEFCDCQRSDNSSAIYTY